MNTTQENTKTKPFLSLDFENPEGEIQQSFMEEVGTLVFQSALIKYFATNTEEASRKFEVYINLHVGSENFFEGLHTEYPEFEEILETEMQAFRSEINSLN